MSDSDNAEPYDALTYLHPFSKVFEQRGRFLSLFNEVEAFIDHDLARHFVPKERTEQFVTWVMGRMSTRDRLDLAEQITSDAGLKDEFRSWFQGLRRANDFRNEIAHSHVALDLPIKDGELDSPDWDAIWSNPISVRTTRTQRVSVADIENELNRQVRNLMELHIGNPRYTVALADYPDTDVMRSLVAEWDASHPPGWES